MAPRKQTIIYSSVLSKGRTNNTVEGTVPLPAVDQQDATKDTGSSSLQGVATSVQPMPLYESQILQMLTDMKEQMKEQQARSDRDREYATLDCDPFTNRRY